MGEEQRAPENKDSKKASATTGRKRTKAKLDKDMEYRSMPLPIVFGRDASYWYRLHQSLGRFSIVGTTVKDPNKMPVNLVADEKHSWLLGERIYIPTTVAAGCILGFDVAEGADIQALLKGYEHFRAEAIALNPDYQPKTVSTDCWDHTQAAWQTLLPGITEKRAEAPGFRHGEVSD